MVGANYSNTNSNANALAASDTFIANYRRGHATVKIPGLSGGKRVAVSLKRIAFDFGGGVNIRDDGVDSQLSGDGTIRQRNYQQRLSQNFNTIVTAGPGYWCDNEPVQGKPIVAGIRGVYQYAAAHHMHARQHNLIWEGNQPEWINALKIQAISSTSAKAKLSAAIDSRIGYYLASGDTKYDQIDVYNESYNDGELGGPETYLHLLGMSGIAQIHHDAKQAALQAGYAPALFVNDYGALQGVSNQYSQHIEALRQAGLDAGYGEVVDGIGLQYYTKEAITSRAVIADLQMMNVQGLPLVLTEFGTFPNLSAETSATTMNQAMRLIFGNPASTGFVVWDWIKEDDGSSQFAPGAALYTVDTSDWSTMAITPAGESWQDTLGIHDWDGDPNNGWTTQLTATAAADGTVYFQGFYGEYELNVGGKSYDLKLIKGVTKYDLSDPTRRDAADSTGS